MERLILDTTVLVSAERGAGKLEDLVADDDDVAIAAVTAAELLVGVELADQRRRPRRARLVEAVISDIPIEPYDLDVARVHARLLGEVRRKGRPRGAHDLMIAATAVTSARTVVTSNPSHFEQLPGILVHGV